MVVSIKTIKYSPLSARCQNEWMYDCCAVAETSAATATVTATAAATEDSYDDVLVAYIEILKLCVCACVAVNWF